MNVKNPKQCTRLQSRGISNLIIPHDEIICCGDSNNKIVVRFENEISSRTIESIENHSMFKFVNKPIESKEVLLKIIDVEDVDIKTKMDQMDQI
jgi:hypothetical protein